MRDDEKDKIIEHLRRELDRHKKQLSSVLEMKARWQKNRDAYGKRYTLLHNDYVRLINLLQANDIPLPNIVTPVTLKESVPIKTNFSRKRWKQ